MKFKNLLKCPEGHKLGNITYKMEVEGKENKRGLVRKVLEDIFYCQECKKFYTCKFVEAVFTPKTKEANSSS